MSHIKQYLDKLRVRTFTQAGAITDIAIIVKQASDACVASSKIFLDLTQVEKKFDDDLYARICVKKLIQELFYMGYEMDCDPKALVQRVCAQSQTFLDDPQWSFLKGIEKDILDEEGNVIIKEPELRVQVVEGIDVKVVTKVDPNTGKTKIKKGGKRPLAIEMYKKHVIEGGMANKDFVKLIMKELDLTQAGANTYSWNIKSGTWPLD